jgi:hypothetical protein
LGQLDLAADDDVDDEPFPALSGDASDSDDDHEPFPELDTGTSDEEGGTDDEELLRELEEEAELERELAEEEGDEETDDDGSSISESSSTAVSRFLARNTVKPDENAQAFLAPSEINALTTEQKTELLGYDTRQYKDKGKKVISDITGQNKFVWDEIQPGYGSESGEDEVRRSCAKAGWSWSTLSHSPLTASATSQRTFTTTFRTSATTSMASASCAQRGVTSSTNSSIPSRATLGASAAIGTRMS